MLEHVQGDVMEMYQIYSIAYFVILSFLGNKIENNYSKAPDMMLLDELLNKAHIVAIQGNAFAFE